MISGATLIDNQIVGQAVFCGLRASGLFCPNGGVEFGEEGIAFDISLYFRRNDAVGQRQRFLINLRTANDKDLLCFAHEVELVVDHLDDLLQLAEVDLVLYLLKLHTHIFIVLNIMIMMVIIKVMLQRGYVPGDGGWGTPVALREY